MVAGCGPTCAKWTLFAFNLIFWVTGAIILGVGIWVRVDPTVLSYLHIATISTSENLVSAASIVLICVGLFIFITGFFGCCGAAKENGCMLLTYAGILVFILILQVVAGILAAVFRNKINSILQDSMNMTVKTKYGTPNNNFTTLAYNTMQINFKCCGANGGVSDWDHTPWQLQQRTTTNYTVPLSCCVLTNNDPRDPKPKNVDQCQAEARSRTKNPTSVYATPCYQGLMDWLHRNIGILIGVAFGLVFIQIFVIVLACLLRKAKAAEYQYV